MERIVYIQLRKAVTRNNEEHPCNEGTQSTTFDAVAEHAAERGYRLCEHRQK